MFVHVCECFDIGEPSRAATLLLWLYVITSVSSSVTELCLSTCLPPVCLFLFMSVCLNFRLNGGLSTLMSETVSKSLSIG